MGPSPPLKVNCCHPASTTSVTGSAAAGAARPSARSHGTSAPRCSRRRAEAASIRISTWAGTPARGSIKQATCRRDRSASDSNRRQLGHELHTRAEAEGSWLLPLGKSLSLRRRPEPHVGRELAHGFARDAGGRE